MNLEGRRESSNVEDRRGRSGGKTIAGIGGIGGIIIVLLMTFLGGGDWGDAMQQIGGQMTEQQAAGDGQQEFSPEEQELAKFSSQIFAGTEDVWTQIFKENGLKYECPKLVLYTGSTSTGCGQGQAQMGPFYCSADQTVYIDLSFFMQMRQTLGADGDFAYAYVIAHEVGHHVQYLLGTLGEAHNKMSHMSKAQANEISVRLELQADFYAGVWAHHDNKMFGSLEDGDLEEALNCAQKIGDDYLQKQAQGYDVPESFTHGTSQQRHNWLKKGLQTGDVSNGDTFTPSYRSL